MKLLTTILLIGFLFLCIVVIIAVPIGLVKVMKAKKQPCPHCESEIRFAANFGKCPKCRTKIYKHGDRTLRLRT